MSSYSKQDSIGELLIEFVNTDLTMKEFLKREKDLNDDTDPKENLAIDLKPKELEHEYCHAIAWARNGIRSNFYRKEDGSPYTDPNDVDFLKYLKDCKVLKEDLISLYLEVVTEPERHGISLDSSDLLYKEILRGRIKTKEGIVKFRENKAN